MRRIITVGREFGSGGREIGRRIAEELQIAYYDQEIITEIAKRTALSEAYIRQIDLEHYRNSPPAPVLVQEVSFDGKVRLKANSDSSPPVSRKKSRQSWRLTSN